MKARQIGITLLVSSPLLSACGSNYEPLGVYEVFIDAYSYRDSFSHDGGDYNAKFAMCMRDLASGLECGRRLDPTDEYDDDTLKFETKGEETWITTCYEKYDQEKLANDQVSNAECMAPYKSLSTGQEVGVTVNDEFSESLITIPTIPKVISPLDDAEVSLSANSGVNVVWEDNGADGDTIRWHFYLRYGEPEACGDGGIWFYHIGGDVEDTGSTLIPMEVFPEGLPAEGCAVTLEIDRSRPGKKDPGIKHEYIFGHQVYEVPLRLKP